MNTTIHNGDFRDHLDKIPDTALLITDPPYNIGYKYDEYPDNLSEDEYIEMLCDLQKFRRIAIIHYPIPMMKYVLPSLGVPDHVGAWCYNSNIPNRLRLIAYYGCTPDYSRIRQPYKNPTDKRIKERIANGDTGGKLYEWWSDINIVKNVTKGEDNHPCPVPVDLIKRIITLCAQPNDIIFDPFAGSGTTLVAAQQLGYETIGCELSNKYIEIAQSRLMQPSLMAGI